MSIDKREYTYKVVRDDSLVVIARKHGLSPARDWARKIWEHLNNKKHYESANRYGENIKRLIHIGQNRYDYYNHSLWQSGYPAYDDPHQVILYEGEEIYIPKERGEAKVIKMSVSDFITKKHTFETGEDYRIVLTGEDFIGSY